MDKTSLHFRAEPDLEAAIAQAAARDDRNVSDWIRAVLKRELRRVGLLDDLRKSQRKGRR